MEPFQLHPEVFVAALAAYAVIALVITVTNARRARRLGGGVDKSRPGRHVLHEGRAKALVGQVFGGDR